MPNYPTENQEIQEKSVVGDAEILESLRARLHPHHLKMLIEESGISADVILERGYVTVDNKQELSSRGFTERQSKLVPCVLIPLHGADGSIVLYQIRPDNPWSDRRKSPPKPLKYETIKGEHVRLDFPTRCQADIGNPSIELWITEGVKKVDALVSRGCCAIGLIGVDAWAGTNQHGGKTALPDWRDVALNDRLVRIVYDNDVMQKKEVYRALKRLKEYLEYKKAKVQIVYLPTLPGLDKVGVDDFLVRGHTIDDLRQLSSTDLRPPVGGDDEERQDLRQSDCAAVLKDAYQDKFLFAIDRSLWFQYGAITPGIWSPIKDEQMQNRLFADIGALAKKGFSWTFLHGVERMLRGALGKQLGRLPHHLLPFQNGILNTLTMEVLEHSPERFSAWCLPYDYDASATCRPVQEWLKEALGGEDDLVNVMRAYLRAIITGRTSIQKFLELLGPGGTGKSTLINLAVAIVGESNTAVTELKHLESSRFEAAKLAGKRLIVITDADRYGGQVATLKALVGQDQVRWEEKNNKRLGHFVADGMVIVAANEPVQSADYTSGLERRRLTVSFDKVAKTPRPLIEFDNGDVIGEFASYLPGTVVWALGMPEQEMIEMLVHRSSSIPGLLSARIRRLRETNPLADWADESLVYAPGNRVNVGMKKPLKHIDGYENEQTWLYPNYITYMDRTAHNHVAIQRFKGLLDDLCRSQLRLEGVFHSRDKDGSHFMGLKIRVPSDPENTRLIESALISQAKATVTDGDGSVTDEVIDNDEDYRDDGVFNSSLVKEKEERGKAALPSLSSSSAIQKESEAKKPSSPSSSTLATTYSNDSPSPSVMSVINPALPMDSRTTCPQCGCAKIEWGVFAGICQQCKFVIEETLPG